jgi:methylmalonyl-CoA/ethylmalonyl-CoA epimerase
VKLKRIDHVGVIVADLAEAQSLLEASLELEPQETIARSDINAAFYACGDTRVEVIEVLDPAERAKRLHGEPARIEHLAFEVDDLDETLKALSALGIELAGPPRVGPTFRSAFTVPATSGGLMLQLSERL